MKSQRVVSLALVLVVVAAGFAGCLGSKNVPQQSATELSSESFWADLSVEYSLPVMTSEQAERSERSKPTVETSAKPSAKPSTTKPHTTKPATTKPTTTAPSTSTAASTEAKTKKQKPGKAKTGAAFFDDVVFVGDSVTVGLKNTATARRNAGKNFLGKAKFLCNGSLSFTNCTMSLSNSKSVHPKINGKKVYIEDGVAQLGAKKVFLMLGMNDFFAYDNNKVIEKATALINRIIKKSPGIQVYVESVTPITADKQHGKFSNKHVDAFNQKLKTMCEQNGWTYVDVNSQLKDASGNLNPAYCGDPKAMGIHMSQKGGDKWAEYLTSTFAS